MSILVIAALGQTVLKLLLGAVAIFLILLVLVQRGRGGGLAGALGGMGGSSAFGAKAGDVFTRVTVVAATIWILLCIAALKLSPNGASRINTNTSSPVSSTATPGPVLSNAEEADEANAPAGDDANVPAAEDAPAEGAEAPSDEAEGGEGAQQ